MSSKSSSRSRSMAHILRTGLGLLTQGERRQAYLLLVLMVASGLVDSMVVTSILPLTLALLDPARLASYPMFAPYLAMVDGPQILAIFMAVLVALMLLSVALTLWTTWLIERTGATSKARLTMTLLDKLVAAPMPWLLRRTPVELSRQMFGDLNLWRADVVQGTLTLAQSVIVSFFPMIAVVMLAPSAGIGVLVGTGFVAVAAVLVARKRLSRAATLSKEASLRAFRRLSEMLSGVREVKVSGHSSYFTRLFEADLRTQLDLAVATKVWNVMPGMCVTLVGQLGFIAVAAVMWMAGATGVEIATVLAMLAVVVARVIPMVNRTLGQVGNLYRVAPFLIGLYDLIDDLAQAGRGPECGPGKKPVPANWQSLELRDVSFRYPGATGASVNNASFEIRRGVYYGIAGRSGSGKSTIANILNGLFSPDSGELLLDGKPLYEHDMAQWVRQVGYVPQDPYIFDGTVGENVRFGSPEESEEMLHRAMHLAALDALKGSVADSALASTGDRGKQLSGGQNQRIAIARTFYRPRDLLILDEATSALDTITERRVLENVRALETRPTVVAIAHRLNALRGCDHIFVFDAGNLVAQGTWSSLLAESPHFQAMVRASEREDDPDPNAG